MARPRAEPVLLGNSALIDVIVLVFARSRMRELVGTDALRLLLQGSQRELFPQPRTLALQPVWELLASQEGFDAEQATPPVCRLKLLEEKLEITVELPEPLALDRETIERHAADCVVTYAEVDKAIGQPPSTLPATRAIETVAVAPPAPVDSRQRLAAIAAVIGLGAAGISGYLTFGGDGPANTGTPIPPEEISRDIPLREVRLEGSSLLGVLADPRWSIEPEAVRRSHLEAAAAAVRSHGGMTLVVVDPGGVPAGTLVLMGQPVVMFPPRP